MIQLQRPEVWQKAAARLKDEPQAIRRHEPHLWLVTNKKKNHTYTVRLIHQDGKVFIRCGCEAGSPTKGQRVPMACKHAAAVSVFLRAIREMRRATSH